MPSVTEPSPAHWYQRWSQSLSWRIAASVAIVMVLLLIAQSLLVNYLSAQQDRRPGDRSANTIAAIVAADVAAALTREPDLDLDAYLRHYEYERNPIYVLMKDGRLAANTWMPLRDGVRHLGEVVLAGEGARLTSREEEEIELVGPPVVTMPIMVHDRLDGLVLLTPPDAWQVALDLQRRLSWPGTLLLMLAAAIATAIIFGPTRRRLKALELASRQLGAGDLNARAPEDGGDEIARVASAFNRMATELSARDEALRQSDRMRRQMLADVSHELKTPLTAMRGYIETLQILDDDALDPAARDRYLATLNHETGRLERIVKDLLDLARLEHGVGTMEPRLFAIGQLFTHVAQRHEQEAARRRIALRWSVDDAVDQVTADPDRLEQVIENLTANALRHTPDGGVIELSASADGVRAGSGDDGAGAVVLRVQDSGGGIAPEHVPHVFERFYKVDAARATRGGRSDGSGLGLSIAKAIVDRHGGTIQLTSAPGRTVFTIRLPRTCSPHPTR